MFYLLVVCVLLHSSSADVGWYWHVTDFHYDFTYDSGNGTSCVPAVPVPQRGKFGHHWCDSNWRLIDSAARAMNRIKADADFVVWTGDNSQHEYHGQFLDNTTLYGTLQNITDLLHASIPGPLYPTLGNHDILPKNQIPPHNHDLYNVTWGMWKSNISADQVDNYLKGAYYRQDLGSKGTILSLNTNLYYTSNKQTTGLDDPAGQFQWLEDQLGDIQTNGRWAIVIAHIGPGVLPQESFIWMYKNHQRRLLNILQKFGDVIRVVHVGHDHLDRFRLLLDESDKPLVPIYFGLSVTPWRYTSPTKTQPDRNPGIRLISYDRETGKHLDLHQYFLHLNNANRDGVANWSLLYKMTEEFGIADLSAESLAYFWGKMRYDVTTVDLVLKVNFARMDLNKSCDRACRVAHYCSVSRLTVEEYKDCVGEEMTSVGYRVGGGVGLVTAVVVALSWLFD